MIADGSQQLADGVDSTESPTDRNKTNNYGKTKD